MDLLGEEEVSAEHMAKLEAYKAASNNYSLLYDFGKDGISKISTDTDFGNAWKGELSIQTDYEYGKLMVCNTIYCEKYYNFVWHPARHTNAATAG